MAEQQRALTPAEHFVKVQGHLNNEKVYSQLLRGLPPSLTDKQKQDMAGRIRRIMLSLSQRPGMQRIKPDEFAITAIRAAEIGLDPEPVLGKINLIPYGEKLQIVIGYPGWMDLGYRSGLVKEFRVGVVWKEDMFEYSTGIKLTLEHKPDLTVEHSPHGPKSKDVPLGTWLDEDTPECVWAVAELNNGGVVHTVLPRWKVFQYRARSGSWRNAIRKREEGQWVAPTVWETDAPAMFSKTALLRLRQVGMPISSDIIPAMAYDADLDPAERPKDYVSPATEQIVNVEAELYSEAPASEQAAEEGERPEQPPQPAVTVGMADFNPEQREVLLRALKQTRGLNTAKASAWLAERGFQTVEDALIAAQSGGKNDG